MDCALVVLVARHVEAEEVARPALAGKSRRPNFRVNGLGKALSKRQAEHVGTQVIDGDDATKSIWQRGGSVHFDLFAALILVVYRVPLRVDDTEVLGVQRIVPADVAVVGYLRPPSRGEVKPADLRVGVPVDRPVERVADDEALGIGLPDRGDQEATLATKIINWVLYIGKVKNWNSLDAQCGVIHLGIAPNLDNGGSRMKLPLRIRKLARRNNSVMHPVQIRTQLVDHLTGEEKRRGRSKEHCLVFHLNTNGASHVIKRARIATHVISRMRADNVLMMSAALVHHVSACRDLACG